MATTLYVGSNAATYASEDIGTILSTAHGPAANASVFAIGGGEQKLKFFYSSQSAGVALPTLTAPNALPPSNNSYVAGVSSGQFVWTGIGATGGPIFQLLGTEYAEFGSGSPTAPGAGAFFVNLTFAAGSPDAGSPGQYYLDNNAIIIISDLIYQGA